MKTDHMRLLVVLVAGTVISSGALAQNDPRAVPTGDACTNRFPDDGNWRQAFENLSSGQCWSCPVGTDRTWEAVNASDACAASWNKGETKALFRGFKTGPIGGVNTTPAAGSSTVTFYVATDTQIGQETISSFATSQHAVELNLFADRVKQWPDGSTLGAPLAVVTTGDLTDSGVDHQLTYFRWLYEKEHRTFYGGNNLISNQSDHTIRYPVLVGLGNHDTDSFCVTNGCVVGMFKYVRIRHAEDSGITSYDGKTGSLEAGSHSYAWKWNNVHFVQLHNWFRSKSFGRKSHNSQDRFEHATAETWLRNYLGSLPAGTPVVLFQHFPPDRSYSDTNWPQSSDVQALQNLLGTTAVKVVAVFSGHEHRPRSYDWTFTNAGRGISIPVFVGGTGGQASGTTSSSGQFYVVEVGSSHMKVALAEWVGVPVQAGGTNAPTAKAQFVTSNKYGTVNRTVVF